MSIMSCPKALAAMVLFVITSGCSHKPSAGGGDGGSGHSVALNWNASTTPDVTYNVYRGTASGGPYSMVMNGITATSATDSSVSSATTYYYTVRAQNSAGESTDSNEIPAAIP
jgi:hypothetical protein